MRSRSPCHEAGFTLVEMLVALVIFALLSAAGVTVLRSSVDTQAAVDRGLSRVTSVARLHALLESDLGQAIDRPTRMATGERPAFNGDASGMEFVRAGWANLDQEPRGEVQRVEWRFAADAFARAGYARIDGDEERQQPAPFARDLTRASLRYRMPDGGWSSAFRSTEQTPLPAAVELTLEPRAGAAVVMIFALPDSGGAPAAA